LVCLHKRILIEITSPIINVSMVTTNVSANYLITRKQELIRSGSTPLPFSLNGRDTYTWLWLPEADIKKTLSLRNAEHVLQATRTSLPISQQQHEEFIERYNSLERIDFLCLHENTGEYIGGVNLSMTQYGYEIGKYIGNANYLGKGIAFLMSKTFIDFLKINCGKINIIKSVTKTTNLKNIQLNEKLGFKIKHLIGTEYYLMEL
jgi:RimJ/RimL family protein N-acetyltransferase